MKTKILTVSMVLIAVGVGGIFIYKSTFQPHPKKEVKEKPVESKIGLVYAQETHYVKPSPDGKYLYIFNMDSRNIIVLDLRTRTIVANIKMPGFWAQASNMIFSSDGRWMYTSNAGFEDRYVVIIDTEAKKITSSILLPKEYEPSSSPNGPFLAISPDEEFLYIPGANGIYRVNIKSEQVTKISSIGQIVFLIFTPNGKYLLGTNIGTDSLDIVDPDSGGLIDSIPVGHWPQYIVESPDGQIVYVTNWESGDVSIIDLAKREVIATVPVGVNPLGMAVTPDGSKLYVAVTAQALEHVKIETELVSTWMKVVVINTQTYAIVKEIMSGWAPRYVNISPDGIKIYVNEYRAKAHIIDTISNEIIDSLLLTRPATYVPNDITVTPDGSKIFVYCRNIKQVLVIDTATHTLLARFDVFSNAIAISSDGKKAYIPGHRFTIIDIPNLKAKYIEMPDIIGLEDSKIILSEDETVAYILDNQRDILQAIDLENWQLKANVPVGDMGPLQFGLAITPDGNKLFVSNGYSNNISVVSTAENKVIDTVPLAATPIGIDISPDGKVAYVIERQPGGYVLLVVIDVATHKVIQRLTGPIGFGNPFNLVFSPDGKHIYFGGVDGEIAVIMDVESGNTRYIEVGLDPWNIALTKDGMLLYVSNSGSDDITVINTQTEKVVDRIPIQIERD